MTPTNRLRFVEREVIVYIPMLEGLSRKPVKILQQWWHENDEPPPSSRGEWRDVPLEQE